MLFLADTVGVEDDFCPALCPSACVQGASTGRGLWARCSGNLAAVMLPKRRIEVRMDGDDDAAMQNESMSTTFVTNHDGIDRHSDSGHDSDWEGDHGQFQFNDPDLRDMSPGIRGSKSFMRGRSGVWVRGRVSALQSWAIRFGIMPRAGDFGGWDSDSLGGWAGGWGNEDGVREHDSLDFDVVRSHRPAVVSPLFRILTNQRASLTAANLSQVNTAYRVDAARGTPLSMRHLGRSVLASPFLHLEIL
jgi:hypothetical protein